MRHALDELEGSIIAGKYRLDRLIGRGGFSAVFRGEHVAMNRTIAVKVLDPHYDVHDEDATWTQRFEREARVISQLQHPNTITVYDYGIEDELHYIIMEFVEGRSLGQEIKSYGAMAPARAVHIALEILSSLEEAHHVGILHRDLKPANIMLTYDFKGDEHVRVLDFGIAKLMERGLINDGTMTEEDRFVGTPRYAAPEQLLAQEVTPSTDVFGVGALLFEMLVGAPMLSSTVWGECVTAHLEGPTIRVPSSAGIPSNLSAIVHGAIARHPDDRYASCAELIEKLDAWLKADGGAHASASTQALRPHASTGQLRALESTRSQDEIAPPPHPIEFDATVDAPSHDALLGNISSFDPNVMGSSNPWLSEPSEPRVGSTERETVQAKPVARQPERPSRRTGPARPSNALDFSNAEVEMPPHAGAPSSPGMPPLADASASSHIPAASASPSRHPATRAPAPTPSEVSTLEPLRPVTIRKPAPNMFPILAIFGLLGIGIAFIAFNMAGTPDAPSTGKTTARNDTLEMLDETLDSLEASQRKAAEIISPDAIPANLKGARSAFSNEGILLAIDASKLERSGSSKPGTQPEQGTIEIHHFQGSGPVDVHIFESHAPDAIKSFALDAKQDEHIVRLDDYKAVKFVRKGKARSRDVEDAVDKLMTYRALVLESKGGGQ